MQQDTYVRGRYVRVHRRSVQLPRRQSAFFCRTMTQRRALLDTTRPERTTQGCSRTHVAAAALWFPLFLLGSARLVGRQRPHMRVTEYSSRPLLRRVGFWRSRGRERVMEAAAIATGQWAIRRLPIADRRGKEARGFVRPHLLAVGRRTLARGGCCCCWEVEYAAAPSRRPAGAPGARSTQKLASKPHADMQQGGSADFQTRPWILFFQTRLSICGVGVP